jgi:hypothetical protein
MARRVAAAAAAGAILVLAWRVYDPYDGRVKALMTLAGLAFGAILQRSRFCFASGFRDLFLLRDRRVATGLLAALAVGSLGYLVVYGARIPDAAETPGLPAIAHITPAGWHLALGGIAFGLGMVLAGGCVSGSLYRLGEGSLVAPVTLAGILMGFWAGYLSWRFFYTTAVATAPLVWFPKQLGWAGSLGLYAAALGGLAFVLLRNCPALPPKPGVAVTPEVAVRKVLVDAWPAWLGGSAIGLLATLTFLRGAPLSATAEIGRLSHRAGVALGFVPQTLTGLGDLRGCSALAVQEGISANALFLIGLVGGSLVAALLSGEFKPRSGRPRTFLLAWIGGLLMGFGAMISLGCTVGTLLSGIMAFSLSGWIFAAGLLGGAWAGVRVLRRLA